MLIIILLLVASCSNPRDWNQEAQVTARAWVESNTQAIERQFPSFSGGGDEINWSGDTALVLGVVRLDGAKRDYGVLMLRKDEKLTVLDGKITP